MLIQFLSTEQGYLSNIRDFEIPPLQRLDVDEVDIHPQSAYHLLAESGFLFDLYLDLVFSCINPELCLLFGLLLLWMQLIAIH